MHLWVLPNVFLEHFCICKMVCCNVSTTSCKNVGTHVHPHVDLPRMLQLPSRTHKQPPALPSVFCCQARVQSGEGVGTRHLLLPCASAVNFFDFISSRLFWQERLSVRSSSRLDFKEEAGIALIGDLLHQQESSRLSLTPSFQTSSSLKGEGDHRVGPGPH